jgi:hypothetical protein
MRKVASDLELYGNAIGNFNDGYTSFSYFQRILWSKATDDFDVVS